MDLRFHREYFLETCYIISLSLKFTKLQRQYDQEKHPHTMKKNKENFLCLNDAWKTGEGK